MNKASLRKSLRRERDAMRPQEIASKSAAIVERLQKFVATGKYQTVLSFRKLGAEPDLAGLLTALPTSPFGFPVVSRTEAGAMEFFRWWVGSPLSINQFGIAEPIANPKQKISPAANDILLIPALAVTSSGIRLGYGGGYYDRFCARYPAIKRVAVVFDEFVVEELPEESHDLRMHFVATNSRLITCQTESARS